MNHTAERRSSKGHRRHLVLAWISIIFGVILVLSGSSGVLSHQAMDLEALIADLGEIDPLFAMLGPLFRWHLWMATGELIFGICCLVVGRAFLRFEAWSLGAYRVLVWTALVAGCLLIAQVAGLGLGIIEASGVPVLRWPWLGAILLLTGLHLGPGLLLVRELGKKPIAQLFDG